MSDTEKPVSSTDRERQDALHRLWLAQIKKLTEKVENTPAAELEAATLTAARQFLSDNGVTTDSLKHQTGNHDWRAGTVFEGKSGDEISEMMAREEADDDLPLPDPE
jgi:hypothetical protein